MNEPNCRHIIRNLKIFVHVDSWYSHTGRNFNFQLHSVLMVNIHNNYLSEWCYLCFFVAYFNGAWRSWCCCISFAWCCSFFHPFSCRLIQSNLLIVFSFCYLIYVSSCFCFDWWRSYDFLQLNEILVPNPFNRPRAVFLLEVNGYNGLWSWFWVGCKIVIFFFSCIISNIKMFYPCRS